MDISFVLLVVSLILLSIWLVGFVAYGYHVFAFGLPSDTTKKSFYVLFTLAAFFLLLGVYYFSGFDWRAI